MLVGVGGACVRGAVEGPDRHRAAWRRARRLYRCCTRDWALWRRLHLVGGHAPSSSRSPRRGSSPCRCANREFFDFFFIHEHFTRFLTNEHQRKGAWWYFIPSLAVGILPWLAVLLWTRAPAMWSMRRCDSNGFSWQRFARRVGGVHLRVLQRCRARSCLPTSCRSFPRWRCSSAPAGRAAATHAGVADRCRSVAIAGVVGDRRRCSRSARIARRVRRRAPAAGAAARLRAVDHRRAASIALRRRRRRALLWLRRASARRPCSRVASTSLLACQLVLSGHDELAESRSAAPILSRIVARSTGRCAPDVPFYTVRMYDQTLPFYLGRTVTQVENEDELAMGIASEPDKAIATVERVEARAGKPTPQAYAIMPHERVRRAAARRRCRCASSAATGAA